MMSQTCPPNLNPRMAEAKEKVLGLAFIDTKFTIFTIFTGCIVMFISMGWDGMGWDKLSGTGVVMFNGMGPGGQSPHALDILLGLKQEREQPN